MPHSGAIGVSLLILGLLMFVWASRRFIIGLWSDLTQITGYTTYRQAGFVEKTQKK